MDKQKPLGIKSYGSIPHLPGSRTGPADKTITGGQYRICCEKTRDDRDIIYVQEKLDGSNCCVTKINGEVIALTRAGYLASSSKFKMHHVFNDWVIKNKSRFSWIRDGSRICGEWLYQAHGTRYKLKHEPFVIFDYWTSFNERFSFNDMSHIAAKTLLPVPMLIHKGVSLPLDAANKMLGERGFHGAQENAEGVVYRVERNGKIDFVAKFVRKDKVDGKYLDKEIINRFK